MQELDEIIAEGVLDQSDVSDVVGIKVQHMHFDLT